MSGTDDLRDLLDRLRDEAGPAGAPATQAKAPPGAGPLAQHRPEPVLRRYSPDAREDLGKERHASDLGWRENREAVFFGMMAALVAALGGVLAGLDYLVMAGTAVFVLFSAVMAYALAVHARPASSGASDDLKARLDTLARRVETLSSRPSGRPAAGQVRGGGDPETDRKIEELYSLFRSLSKAVGRKD